MKARAGKKKVVLELGGNAGVIVDETADLDSPRSASPSGGFALAGQSCISVQRVFVHASVFDRFASALVARVEALKVGDPLDPATDVGPMIDGGGGRARGGVGERGRARGARVLTGGRRLGPALYAPTVLTDVPETREGLRAGGLRAARRASTRSRTSRCAGAREPLVLRPAGRRLHERPRYARSTPSTSLEVGGVIVNDVSAWRIDHMPYGGVKDSGLGREGPRYAIEEMTEPKIVVINRERRRRAARLQRPAPLARLGADAGSVSEPPPSRPPPAAPAAQLPAVRPAAARCG